MSSTFEPPDKKSLSTKYVKVSPSYERLIEEISFIVEKAIDEQKIKIHDVRGRVKDFNSFYNKIVIKKIKDDPFEKINDVAGIRIICLYRSDLDKIGRLLAKHLKVIEADVKTKESRETEFGYMADHYIVRLPKGCKGPRYDDIRPLKCEIQVRTILMDAWDSVSHHLDYKRKSDIPSSVMRDFYALSGLFYVADSHFELFKDSVEKIRQELIESVEKDQFNLDQEMNLDTLRAYLGWKLPNRETTKDIHYSELLSELQKTGYSRFQSLDEDLDRSIHIGEMSEKEMPPSTQSKRFTDVGIVRASLEILNPRFLRLMARKSGLELERYEEICRIKKYRALMKTRNQGKAK